MEITSSKMGCCFFLIMCIPMFKMCLSEIPSPSGACPGFLKGGVQYLLVPKKRKRSSDFKRGGVQWSDGGGPVN